MVAKIFILKKLGKCCTEQKKHLPLQSQLRNHCDNMVELAQLVRASDCGSEGRGFEPHIPPH